MDIVLAHGLANRLRTLMGYLWVTRQKEQELNVCWPIDDDCNGHFLDIFQPLDGVNFVEFDDQAGVDFRGCDTFHQILRRHNYFDANIYEEHRRMYGRLQPLAGIQKQVRSFCEDNRISTCIGLHIRRTDHKDWARGHQSFTSDALFIDFIQRSPRGSSVFIATDNRETQTFFASLFPDRVLFYSWLTDLAALRKTSLEAALIDALICGECRSFKGSGYSSYSDFIEILRSLR